MRVSTRVAAAVLLSVSAACTTLAPPPTTNPSEPSPYGMTVEEEAGILAIEDRRQYDAAYVAAWVAHPNPLHRIRIAQALGRIGPHAFVDANGNGQHDPPAESRAGVAELMVLAKDAESRVRESAAFALGEIGDPAAADTLFALASDADSNVAAESVESLSKLAADPVFRSTDGLTRYLELTGENLPEGVRARAVRFLFRFDDDRASAVALKAVESSASAVRQEGAYALSRRPWGQAKRPLELLLNDANVLTRAYAATALGRIGEASSAPLLLAALGDVHPWVRTNAAIAIGRIAARDGAILRAEDLPRVFAATEDPDPGVRASMIDTLGYYARENDTARARLLEILANSTQWERELAAGAVAKHFAPDSEPWKQLAVLTPWQIVRVLEATSAAPHGAAIRSQHSSHQEPIVRAAVIGAIPDEAVNREPDLTLVRTALSDPDVVVRANAIDRYALVKSEPGTSMATMLEKIERDERASELNDARLSALRALSDIDRPERAAYLRTFLSDNDPVVRRLAADFLVEKVQAARPSFTPLPLTLTQADYEEIVRWARQPHSATIHMTRGKIELALLTQEAPMTTWNFARLAGRKYFDNTSFMRVVPNFVIQGGDPRNDMNGGPGYAIRDEINLQKYTRGAVGMALSGPDTGGSQFFVTHSPQPHLDGGYTIFGRVFDGMAGVVDQVERGDRVVTITIDEHAPAAPAEIASVPNVSLPLVTGKVTLDQILAAIPSYAEIRNSYKPDADVLEMMKSSFREGDRVEVFMGTWCPDSEREVPKLLRIVDDLQSQFGVTIPVSFVAVDRSKQEPAPLLRGKGVDKISTFIYYRGERELGRVVERPTSLFEDDLLAIVASGQP